MKRRRVRVMFRRQADGSIHVRMNWSGECYGGVIPEGSSHEDVFELARSAAIFALEALNARPVLDGWPLDGYEGPPLNVKVLEQIVARWALRNPGRLVELRQQVAA